MSYQIIPQHYRDLINNQYPQINDEHKKQLGELWSVLFEIGGAEQTGPQFDAFLREQIENINDSQLISDRIDAEISQIEGLTGGKKKSKKSFRKSSKRRRNKSSKRRNKKSRKNKKSYKKRK